MRWILVVVLALAAVALAVFGVRTHRELTRVRSEKAAVQAQEEDVRTRYDSALGAIAAIQDSLDAVVVGEEGAEKLADELASEQQLSRSRGDEAMARIAVIKAGVQRAKDRIGELEHQLRASGLEVAGLQRVVDNLKQTVAEREAMIGELTARVASLETEVTQLNAEVAQNQQTIATHTATIATQQAAIEDSRREIQSIFVTVGTKDQLEDEGVVRGRGGILGIRRTLTCTGARGAQAAVLDLDRQRELPITAKKARVVCEEWSPSAYELQPDGEGRWVFRVLDPAAFRANKQVVILTE